MIARNFFDSIREKQLLTELSWRKYYDNGTSLWEYKIYKPKSRNPIAYIQIGQYDISQKVIGVTVTYANDMENPIDCVTLSEFENILDNLKDKTMDIKQFVCATAYEFLEKHYNELRETPENLGFKSKEDLFECVKNNPLDAIWCIREIFTCDMGTDYCSQLFIENEEEDIYKATLNGETRYYQLEFDETYLNKVIDFIEVKKHTKLIPVVYWTPMNK